MFDNPLPTVIVETKLAHEDQPRMLVKEPLEVECRKFYVLHANIEAHGRMGGCPGYALLFLPGKASKPREDESESEELLREPWLEKPGWRALAGARMETYKDRNAERKRVRERIRTRIEARYRRCVWRFDMRTHLAVTS